MMSNLGLAESRKCEIAREKLRAMLAKGPADAWHLARNGGRYLIRRRPASSARWHRALHESGFEDVAT